MATYKESVEQFLNIKPINDARHEDVTKCPNCGVVGRLNLFDKNLTNEIRHPIWFDRRKNQYLCWWCESSSGK